MSGGSPPPNYLLSDICSLPGEISFGFPPAPVDHNHWLLHSAANHVGGNVSCWGAKEWELAARYLAAALEISARRQRLHAVLLQPSSRRPRGRPRKGLSLSNLLGMNQPKPRRKPGRPRTNTDEFWQQVYELFNSYRDELAQKHNNRRITDIAAISFGTKWYARQQGYSQAWVRKMIPKFQRLYSESKKRIRKLHEKP
jgi:hypothetical protein